MTNDEGMTKQESTRTFELVIRHCRFRTFNFVSPSRLAKETTDLPGSDCDFFVIAACDRDDRFSVRCSLITSKATHFAQRMENETAKGLHFPAAATRRSDAPAH